ncbi:hypothetical protein AB0L00_23230 [Actinoallomurus sp. NPDC052308]|uniref:hypothetical protein n=1 Tax=Actinoallomurus sp. NPDC052308 TaxID=3155530 RepID=UPI00342B39B8
MTLQDVADSLRKQAAQGTVVLDESLLGLAGLSDLLTATAGLTSVEVAGAELTVTDHSVEVAGTSSLLGLRDAAVAATVAETAGGLRLLVAVRLPVTWRFSQSFPDLPDYLDFGSMTGGYRTTYLDDLDLSEASLILSTEEVTDPQDGVIERGLNFRGSVRLSGPLARIGALTDADTARLGGLVRGPGAATDFCLRAPLALGVESGSVGLTEVAVELCSGLTAAGGTATVRLSAVVTVGAASLRLVSEVRIGGTDDVWALSGDFEGVGLPGLAELADLVGGQDLAAVLPGPLAAPGGITLREVGIGVSLATRTVDYVRVTLGVGDEWPVIPGTFDVRGVAVRWLVTAPFDSGRRAVGCTLYGTVDVGGVGLSVVADLPGLRVTAGLERGQTIRLQDLARQFLPDTQDVPDLVLSDCVLSVQPTARALSLNATLGPWSLPLGQTDLTISRLTMALSYSGGDRPQWDATMTGTAEVAGATASVTVTVGDVVRVSGSVGDVSLAALAGAVAGVSLPDEVPDLRIEHATFDVTPHTGVFSVTGQATARWRLPFGADDLQVDTLDLAIDKGPAGIGCSLSLRGQGPATVVDGLTFERLAFDYRLTPPDTWSLSGSITAQVLDGEVELAASVRQQGGARTVHLEATRDPAAPPFALAGIATLDYRQVTIDISRADGPGSVRLNTSSPYTWQVQVSGGLRIDALPDDALDGTLSLERRTDGFGLAFQPGQATVRVPWPVPGTSLATTLALGPLAISRSAGAWSLDATVTVAFSGLPAAVQHALAERITGRFSAGGGQVRLAIDRVIAPIEIEIPDAQAGTVTIPMGTALLDASDFALTVGGEFRLSADFGVGLPAGLNEMFGTRPDGSPSVEIFRTYLADDPGSVTRFRLSVGSAEGLSVALLTSPIRAVTFQTRQQHTWAVVDLGAYGAFELQVPEFGYDGTAFRANGGFRTTRPLALPLTPLRTLLSGAGLRELADVLPSSVPLNDLEVYDPKTGLNIQGLIDALHLPDSFTQVLRTVEEHVDRLPSALLAYLNVKVPDGFTFDFTITPTGGVRGRLAVEGGTPIRLLLPSVGPLGPQLVGLELREVAVGELFGGVLLCLDLDCTIEQFDLATLAAVLLLPPDGLPMLPDSRNLISRIDIRNLSIIAVYETGIPIVVPLFYDELAYERLGLEGVGLRSHWRFPRPTLDVDFLRRLFAQFAAFFTDPHALLDPSAPPGADLSFTIGPNAIHLPAYMGGGTLGSDQDLATVNVYASVARTLNFLKAGDTDEIIQAVPLDDRVGSVHVAFAPMTLDVGWLITTPDEFRQVAHDRLTISGDDTEAILRVVPATANERGLIALLKGDWRFRDVAAVEVWFGLAATPIGFATGLRVAGDITDLIGVELDGTVVIDPQAQEVFSLSGHSRLTLAGDQVLAGTLSVTGDRFAISGELDLFPDAPGLRVTGWLTGWMSDREFSCAGGVTAGLGPAFVLASANFELSHTGVTLSGTWLGQTAAFTARRTGTAVEFRAEMSPIEITEGFRIGGSTGQAGPTAALAIDGGGVPNVLLAGSITLLDIQAEATVTIDGDGFSVTVTGKLFGAFEAEVRVSGADLANSAAITVVATLEADFLSYVQQQAADALKAAADDATRSIAGASDAVDQAQRQVDGLDRQLADLRSTVQAERDRDQQNLAVAQARVTAAQQQLNQVDQKLAQARATVQAERNTAQAVLRSSQTDLDNDQRAVNSINAQIDSTKKWYYGLPKIDVPWKDSQTTQAIPFSTKMSGLYAALGTATATLEGARKALSVAQAAIPSVPVDADPRVAGLITAQGTAYGSLSLAQGALAAAQALIPRFPVDADPRIAGVLAAQMSATASLSVAQQALTAARAAVGPAIAVADYITRDGLGALLSVQAAGFDGTLDQAGGGVVTVWADLTYMGGRRRAQFGFDFHDPLTSVRGLAHSLIGP